MVHEHRGPGTNGAREPAEQPQPLSRALRLSSGYTDKTSTWLVPAQYRNNGLTTRLLPVRPAARRLCPGYARLFRAF
jgi:hypothetical protein